MLEFFTAFNNFSKFLTIFKRHTKNKFYILLMCKKLINFISEKQLTVIENQKQVNSKLIFTKDFVFCYFKINIQKN